MSDVKTKLIFTDPKRYAGPVPRKCYYIAMTMSPDNMLLWLL